MPNQNNTPNGVADNTGYFPTQLLVGASTGQRPSPPTTFQCYFDTTLDKPVWYDGSDWRDATGAIV